PLVRLGAFAIVAEERGFLKLSRALKALRSWKPAALLLTRHHAQAPAVLHHSRTLPQGDGRTGPAFTRRALAVFNPPSAAAFAPAPATRFRPRLAFRPRYGSMSSMYLWRRFRSAGIITLSPTMRGR